MDPSGSDLDSSLPHAENPCLIVEDSQPDSAALEDDPDSSYRALLARRLSSLQPATSHSPVLELISSPAGNRYSETDSQSERVQNNNHNGPVNQEESQVLEVCSNTRRCATEDMATESGADSTTHCAQSEGGVSKFDFLELSESQGLGEVVGNSQEEEGPTAAQTDSQRHNKPGEQKNTTRGLPSGSQDSKSKRSEVSSSSSSEPLGCAGRELSVQALLHSQGLQASEDQDPKGDDSELLSSQEDLFDTDKTGTGVDSTMSEPENQGVPTLTPAHTQHLLHLAGQGTLVQESLSQNSVDFVAPTQENLSQTPFIVPNSPTGQENELGADEPMDTSMPPEDQSDGKEEPMDTDPGPKSHPSASTPVSQNSPGFVLERTLSLPTQPEFSHDVFVPTQSQEAGSSSIAPQQTHSRKVTSSSQPTALDSSSPKMAAAPAQSKAPTTTDREHSVTDSFQLELSVNTQSCSLAQQASMQAGGKDVEEDSQATQIEGLDGPLRIDTSDSVISQIDTSDSVISRNSQKRDSNGVPSDPKTPAILPKVPQVPDLLKTSGESTRREECNTLQKSDRHKQTTLNVRNVNIGDDGINVIKTDSSQKQDAKASSPSPSSQQKLETIDLFTPSSCVQETPSSSNSTPCSLASLSQSQSVFSQMSHVGSVKALSPSPGVCVDSRRDGGERREVGGGVGSPTSSQKNRDPSKSIQSLSQEHGGTATNSAKEKNKADEEEEEEGMEEGGEKQQDSTLGPEGSGLYLSLSQSQVLSPEPMEEEEEKRGKFPVSHSRREGGEEESSSIIVLEESERSSQLLEKEVKSPSKMGTSQPVASRRGSVSSNGTGSQLKDTQLLPIGLAQAEKEGSTEAEGLRDKSLSDSSGEIPFHFTLPKEGELIGPPVSATPPLISQLKQTPRHSTPIDMTSFSEKSAAVGDVSTETAMATSEITAGESGEDTAEEADGKLSLRMKLVTPVEEGSSERFSLQKPPQSDEEGSVSKVTTVVKAVTSPLPSPSVFSRVREAHRKVMEDQAKAHPSDPGTPVRGELFSSPSQQKSSQKPSIPSPSVECISLPNSQSEPLSSPRQEVKRTLPLGLREKEPPAEPSTPGRPAVKTPQKGIAAGDREPCGPPEPSTPTRAVAIKQRSVSQQTSFDNTISPSSPSKLCQRVASQQTSFEAAGPRSPAASGEPETPPSRAAAGPAHRRHVRTIQEVRTTVTRIITDVYYEDGREVDRKVTEESEEPVVDSRVLDSDISPCRTGSSMTSGDLGDVSSLSSKASSQQHSSGGTSIVTGPAQRGPDFIMPSSRGAKSASPRRGSGPQQRGHRGQTAGSEFMGERVQGLHGSRAFTPLTPRGRARRGRPPSRSPLSRGAGVPRANARGQPLSSSEDESYTRLCPTPRIPESPAVPSHSSTSLLTTTSQDEGSPAGSSFVGLRVVAKWSSNGYFYSGRITKDLGEGRYRLLFDDSYECEVTGKDILLCDPIPLDTEVTALLEDEYFSTGLVKDYKKEGEDLFYSVEKQGQTTATTAVEREGQTTATTTVEREGQTTATTTVEREGQTTATTAVERQWYSRSSVILTMEQGNRLREQYGLGPYEPATPLAKASDISLDNLVEGKRRRRGITGGASPLTPGPSGKRKLISSEDRDRTPAKRGRRGGGGARAGQRVGVCNTSGSGTDLPWDHSDLAETHGPLPQSASLFLGFAFMLTASSESDRQTNQPISDGEEEYVQTAPYHKRYTETQLEAGAGFILHDFNEEQCKAAYQSLLITDQHSRTRKYLLCVASGVPCVSHIWVRDCCKEGKLLNYRNYLLPAGVGPDERIVEWHPRCSPFKALRVLLVFEEPAELWSELLMMSGASSVRQHQAEKDSSDIPVGKFDVVVTDRTCPPLVLKSVTSQQVPMVSPEWLIHSLICGERLGYHSNPQYRHDYTSPPSS
ncbi:TP53-binding protein 1 isoform X2 [Salmo salar]|uniref:TP53-binding protein 1 isoform X2 n=1 Tax=Salmo salar TaxID=8030 RepID=A0ABM3E1M0_SALSA|nr:TP53-binding protein 1 isoform X2 [Salmo salar]